LRGLQSCSGRDPKYKLEREQVKEGSSHYKRSNYRNCKNRTEVLVPAFINVSILTFCK
jgi:hypothetical protein